MSNEKYFQSNRKEVANFLPDQYSKVLEIGCGEGGFRSNLTLKSEYWGVEPSEKAATKASQVLDSVKVGTYDEVKDQLPDHYFDLIICNDVIEHMVSHDEFLVDIQKKLKSGGYLVGSVPNVRHMNHLWELLFKRDWEYQDAGILDRTHLRFFTKKSLLRSLDANGYKVCQLAGVNPNKIYKIRPKSLVYWLSILVFGFDTVYLQYGFKVQLKG